MAAGTADYGAGLFPPGSGYQIRSSKIGNVYGLHWSQVFNKAPNSGNGYNAYFYEYAAAGHTADWNDFKGSDGSVLFQYYFSYEANQCARVVCYHRTEIWIRATQKGRKVLTHQEYDSNGYSIGPANVELTPMEYWAMWAPIFERDKFTFAVKYLHGQYGTGSDVTVNVTEDASTVTKGAIFTRAGYIQDGWQTPDGATLYGLNERIATVSGDITLYPHWQLKPQIAVIFDANGGQKPSEAYRMMREGDAFGTLPTVTRTDYTFLGWFTAATGGTRIYATTTYTETMGTRVFAQWSKNVVKITFNANGGTVSPESVNGVTGHAYGNLPRAIRNRDESFVGWFTAATGGNEITATSIIGETAITLYAQYAAKAMTYTIVFHDTTGSNPTVTKVYTIGVAERFPWLRSGLGWTLPAGYSFSQTTTWQRYDLDRVYPDGQMARDLGSADEEIHLYLITTRNNYVLTFNPNGGTCDIASVEVTAGDQIGTLPTAKLAGKVFDGWYTAATGGTKITAEYLPTASMTLYARFKTGNSVGWISVRVY